MVIHWTRGVGYDASAKRPMPRVTVVHMNYLDGGYVSGGALGVLIHALEALQDVARVRLVTNDAGLDDVARWVAAGNDAYGTSVRADELEVGILAPLRRRFQRVPKVKTLELHGLRQIQLLHAHRTLDDTDVWFSTTGEMAGQGRWVQYVHYPLHASVKYGQSEWLARLLTGRRLRDGRTHRSLANSQWTKDVCERVGIHDLTVVYPPVVAPNPVDLVPWEERASDLVCMGRLVRSKRIEVMLEVARRLHDAGTIQRFHVVGPEENVAYAASLRDQVAAMGGEDWVVMHGALSRTDVGRLLGSVRYGIHAQVNEHFGMAPAEMVRAGCLPFVHDSGGQVEIVAREAALRFTTVEEAAQKVQAVASDPAMAEQLRRTLERQGERFSEDRFAEEIRGELERALRTARA